MLSASARAEGSKPILPLPRHVNLAVSLPSSGPQHAPSKSREAWLDKEDLIGIKVPMRGALMRIPD